ncbi:hypothetical protein JCM11641_008383 [Rhodosporidiobolus odoratus]
MSIDEPRHQAQASSPRAKRAPGSGASNIPDHSVMEMADLTTGAGGAADSQQGSPDQPTTSEVGLKVIGKLGHTEPHVPSLSTHQPARRRNIISRGRKSVYLFLLSLIASIVCVGLGLYVCEVVKKDLTVLGGEDNPLKIVNLTLLVPGSSSATTNITGFCDTEKLECVLFFPTNATLPNLRNTEVVRRATTMAHNPHTPQTPRFFDPWQWNPIWVAWQGGFIVAYLALFAQAIAFAEDQHHLQFFQGHTPTVAEVRWYLLFVDVNAGATASGAILSGLGMPLAEGHLAVLGILGLSWVLMFVWVTYGRWKGGRGGQTALNMLLVEMITCMGVLTICGL